MPSSNIFSTRTLTVTVLLFWISTLTYYGCKQEKADHTNTPPTEAVLKAGDGFIGEQNCMSCHEDQYHKWEKSHHAYAMMEADSSTVKADFNNTKYSKDGVDFRFFTKNNRYWVNTKSPEGPYKDFEVKYTFGVEPLQQYLVSLPGGKLQALGTAWDTDKNKWFHLYDHLKLTHNEWINWSGGAMNWNTMCAQCHTTYLEKNFDETTNAFDTKWKSINVSCEACHGAGKDHIDYIASEKYHKEETKVEGSHMQMTSNTPAKMLVNSCAPCHSRRGQLTEVYDHEGDYFDHFLPSLLIDGLYHADGQIQDEVYVYGSFTQSKMYHNNVTCTNCHDAHTTKIKFQDNNLCLQCHEPSYDSQEHHFHPKETAGAECVNCHMPGKHYMGNDFRRDHSLRVPRPDLSAKYGTPNACNDCHDDKSAEWAAQQVEKWHGKERPYHFSEDLILGRRREPEYIADLMKMLADTAQPVIARATAIQYMHDTPAQGVHQTIATQLENPEPLIRVQAVRSMADLPADQRISLVAPRLNDATRAVRVAAADVLLDAPASQIPTAYQQYFHKARQEYFEYLQANVDSRDGQFAMGQYYDRLNQHKQAEKYYLMALRQDSLYNMSRLNLGVLYNKMGNNDKALLMYEEVIKLEPDYAPAYYSLGLLYAELNRLDKTVEYLKKTISLMPENLRAHYNLGLALQNLGKPQEAEKVYLAALQTAPNYWEMHHAIAILYYQQKNFAKAGHHADILVEQFPNDNNLRGLQAQIKQALSAGGAAR